MCILCISKQLWKHGDSSILLEREKKFHLRESVQDQLCNKVRRVHIVSLVADTIIVTLQLFTVHSSQFTVFQVVHTVSQVVHTIIVTHRHSVKPRVKRDRASI